MKSFLASKIFTVFFLLSFISVNGESQVSLTTATECDSECLKPTPLYRRVDVDRSVEVRESTPLNFFRARDHTQNNYSQIWYWDYLCLLQAKKGSCFADLQKYYYNAQLDQCQNFTYNGCDGNGNNFDTLKECERNCKGAALMTSTVIEKAEVCSLQPNSGLCLAFQDMYYYNVNTETCETLIYGGCGGNDNRFETKHKCLKRCDDNYSRS